MAKKKMVLKRLGVFSVARLEAVIMAVAGFAYGVAASLVIPFKLGMMAGSFGLAAELGFLSIIAMPIAFGVAGFIGGAVGAYIYNAAVEWAGGGIEMEFGK